MVNPGNSVKGKNRDTSSSRSPINSNAAECLLLSESNSARTPGSVAASARNFSHCSGTINRLIKANTEEELGG